MKKIFTALFSALHFFAYVVSSAQSSTLSQTAVVDSTFFDDFADLLFKMDIVGYQTQFDKEVAHLEPGETVYKQVYKDSTYRAISKLITPSTGILAISEFAYKKGDNYFQVSIKKETLQEPELLYFREFDLYGRPRAKSNPSPGDPSARDLLCRQFEIMCPGTW